MVDWTKIKTEYLTTETSYRKLAQKYGVNATTIAKRASKEDWVSHRQQQASKVLSKTLAVATKKKVDRLTRIQDATDKLLDKIEQAIDELDRHLVTESKKVKVIEYNNADRPDKPTKETITENEKLIEYRSLIDKAGLKQIASALKDIKEVQMLKDELDRREQEARIANLQRQAEGEDDDNEIQVVITGKAKEYAK